MRNKYKLLSIIIAFVLIVPSLEIAKAQISIVNARLNTLNVTPASICEVSIVNSLSSVQIVIESQINNSAGEVLLKVRSMPFYINDGMIILSASKVPISLTIYGTSPQANYLKTTQMLSSGAYKYCCSVKIIGNEGGEDEYCEEVKSEYNSFLYLVHPEDKDTIEVKNPILMWTHSEPFNIMATGEYYRMVIVELNDKQSPESGIKMNVPIMLKNNLTTHNLLYPLDAKELTEGKRYGWQVQRMQNGIITDKTEAWEFVLKKENQKKIFKNVALLKRKLDAGYYVPVEGKIYFRFDEEYKGGSLVCEIFNSKREKIEPILGNEEQQREESNYKKSGYNCYELDLNKHKNIVRGFYTLEVLNDKKELYLLKFYVD